MSVAGINVQFGRNPSAYSYYFSRYIHSWGWATWRRAWQHYDHSMAQWPQFYAGGDLHRLFQDSKAERYWKRMLDKTVAGKVDSWAFRWMFASWVNDGLNGRICRRCHNGKNSQSHIRAGEGARHQ